MRIPLVFRVVAPIILLVFTIVSCDVFSSSHTDYYPDPVNIYTVPIARGNIDIGFLDENYLPTTNDIGKMALFVDNNEYTQNVLITAEIRNNHLDNDIVVRVINKENNSLVSFFYKNGQDFPSKVVITIDDEEITGQFSQYNTVNQTYSVEFVDDEGEIDNYENIVLNKNIFSAYEDSDELTVTQNIRLRSITTTLALWTSLALHIDSVEGAGSFESARGFFSKIINPIKDIFVDIAVVAVAVTLLPVSPTAMAIVGTTISVAATSATIVAAHIVESAVVAAAVFHIIDQMPDNLPDDLPYHNYYARPEVFIRLDGNLVPNGKVKDDVYEPLFFRNQGESCTFDITIMLNSALDIFDVIYEKEFLYAYDPETEEKIEITLTPSNYSILSDAWYFMNSNAWYFDIHFENSQLTIVRNNRLGFDRGGVVQFIIPFRQSVAYDGSAIDEFIFNFTVLDK